MKIGIFGTGGVAQAFATRLTELGHTVMLGTRNATEKRKDPKFSEFSDKNPAVALGSFAETAAFGDFLVNASKGDATLAILASANLAHLKGKVLMDVSNPLDFSHGMPPVLIPELSNTNSLGEEIQRRFPELRVVKTLNTMWNGIMLYPTRLEGAHVNYLCGNDTAAKEEVRTLLHGFGWQDNQLMDLGDISSARATEATLPIWLRVYGAKQTGAFNFGIVTGS